MTRTDSSRRAAVEMCQLPRSAVLQPRVPSEELEGAQVRVRRHRSVQEDGSVASDSRAVRGMRSSFLSHPCVTGAHNVVHIRAESRRCSRRSRGLLRQQSARRTRKSPASPSRLAWTTRSCLDGSSLSTTSSYVPLRPWRSRYVSVDSRASDSRVVRVSFARRLARPRRRCTKQRSSCIASSATKSAGAWSNAPSRALWH